MSELAFLHNPPRFLFFTGKGGVGKTSVACATALHLAAEGTRVLLVSTDPASNVGQVLGVTIGNTITEIEQVPGLSALEIDPEQAADAYRERIIAPVRGPAARAGTRLDHRTAVRVLHHRSRLLQRVHRPARRPGTHRRVRPRRLRHRTHRTHHPPAATTRLVDRLPRGRQGRRILPRPACRAGQATRRLRPCRRGTAGPARTRLVLVARAQQSSLAEVDRTHRELAAIGITGQHLSSTACCPMAADDDALSCAVRAREAAAIAAMPAAIAGLPRDLIELKPWNIVGVAALDSLFRPVAGRRDACRAASDAGRSRRRPDAADRRTGARRSRTGHVHGQGRGRQDHRRRRDRGGARAPRPRGPPDHHRPRRPPHRNPARRGPRAAGLPHRPASRPPRPTATG